MNKTTTDSPDIRLYCSFWLGEHWFGIDALAVREVSAQAVFTPIPFAPASVRGFVNLRGQLYLVLNMRGLLGMLSSASTTEGHLIVFKPAVGESFAVYVDRIGDIVEVRDDQIDRPRGDAQESDDLVVSEVRAIGLISGVAKLDAGLLTIVDPRRFLPALMERVTV